MTAWARVDVGHIHRDELQNVHRVLQGAISPLYISVEDPRSFVSFVHSVEIGMTFVKIGSPSAKTPETISVPGRSATTTWFLHHSHSAFNAITSYKPSSIITTHHSNSTHQDLVITYKSTAHHGSCRYTSELSDKSPTTFCIFIYWPTFCTVAVLRGESSVTGVVQLEQHSESSPTKVTYKISGMDPSAKRGFHVQYTILVTNATNISAFGDNSNGCISAGKPSQTRPLTRRPPFQSS
jgi:hypothetical protein